MSKRPLGHGNLRNMGDFKAVAADYAYYLSLSDEGRLYCLTDRQVYVLQVQLEYVGWLTRWYNTDDITQTTVGYIQSELMERLMSCVDIQVLIDQAQLNLSTQTQNQDVQAQILRDALEDRYDGDPTSINPSAPTTDFGASGDRYDALCAGLTAFVYGFARVQADHVRIAQVGGLAAAALVAALLIPGLNFFFIVGASIAVILGMGTIGVSTETAIAALTDQDALGHVICYMRDTLKAESVTEANWSACLNSYPFSVGSHEAIICDFIKPTLASNYLTILNILGQAYDGTINGDAMPACPCEPPPDVPNIAFSGTYAPAYDGTPKTFIENTPTGGSVWDVTYQEATPGIVAISLTMANSGGTAICVKVADITVATSYQHNLCGSPTQETGSGGGNPATEYGPNMGWYGPSAGTVTRITFEPI